MQKVTGREMDSNPTLFALFCVHDVTPLGIRRGIDWANVGCQTRVQPSLGVPVCRSVILSDYPPPWPLLARRTLFAVDRAGSSREKLISQEESTKKRVPWWTFRFVGVFSACLSVKKPYSCLTFYCHSLNNRSKPHKQRTKERKTSGSKCVPTTVVCK